MSKTKILWTDRTENPLTGCNEVRVKGAKESECDNCYARIASASPRLQQFEKYHGVVNEKGCWTGQINFTPKVLHDLLKIKKPQRIFMPSMSDPFHHRVKKEWVDQIMAAIAFTPHLTYQLLTKRPERMRDYVINLLKEEGFRSFCNSQAELWASKSIKWPKSIFNPATDVDEEDDPEFALEIELHEYLQNAFEENPDTEENWPDEVLQNLWLGTTAGTQKAADERIPFLLQTPAAVRFLSIEPLLQQVDLKKCAACQGTGRKYNSEAEIYLGCENCQADGWTDDLANLNWIIIGGESGLTPVHSILSGHDRSLTNAVRLESKSS